MNAEEQRRAELVSSAAGVVVRGAPPSGAQLREPKGQEGYHKELTDKFAWAVGSTFGLAYAGRHTKVWKWASITAWQVLEGWYESGG